MSGIATLVHFSDVPVDPGLIRRMTDAMAHRGPDGIGHVIFPSGAMGLCLLRTAAWKFGDDCPVEDVDAGLVVVLDGRVDNRAEVCRDLGIGVVARCEVSDAELILRSYQAWGTECPKRLIGEFVFLVWDRRAGRVFGARDAIGTRHFYYARGDGWLAVASEIKGILATGRVSRALNDSRILDYLVPEFDRDDAEGTFYRDIQRLPAGHAFGATAQGFRAWRYWDPRELPELELDSMQACAEALREHLQTAVACRLDGDVRYGAMLSGGLDSSSIVGIVRERYREKLGEPLRTYSLVRMDRENCKEWPHVQAMTEGGWLMPTILTTDAPASGQPAFLMDAGYWDEPFPVTHGLTYGLVYEAAARDGCRAVLDGMAGDLLFLGLEGSLDWALRQRSISSIQAARRAYAGHEVPGFWRDLAIRGAASVAPAAIRHGWRAMKGRARVRSPEISLLRRDKSTPWLEARLGQLEAYGRRIGTETELARHAGRYTSGLVSFAHETYGQIAFAAGVEPRSPFSDRRLVEFALRLHPRWKMADTWYKDLLRVAMVGYLPDKVLWRQDLGNHPGWQAYNALFGRVLEVWRGRGVTDLTVEMLSDWIDPDRLRSDMKKSQKTIDYFGRKRLFAIIALADWIQPIARYKW